MRQDILTWAIALMLGVPVVAIALNEVIERLQRQNIPLVETLQHLRNLVLPFLTAWLVMRQILPVDPSGNLIRAIESLFWVAIMYTGLSFLNTTLARSAIVEEYGVGECIVKAGNLDKGFFIVWDGCVRLSVKNPQEKDQEVFCLSSGDCFGEMSLLAGQYSLVTVTVVQDLEAIVIPTKVILDLAEHSAKFSLEINRLIEERNKAIKLVQGMAKPVGKTYPKLDNTGNL